MYIYTHTHTHIYIYIYIYIYMYIFIYSPGTWHAPAPSPFTAASTLRGLRLSIVCTTDRLTLRSILERREKTGGGAGVLRP